MRRVEVEQTPEKPYATVERVSRFRYLVKVMDPGLGRFYKLSPHDDREVLGRERAERKAKRMLEKYLRLKGYQSDPIIRFEAGS